MSCSCEGTSCDNFSADTSFNRARFDVSNFQYFDRASGHVPSKEQNKHHLHTGASSSVCLEGNFRCDGCDFVLFLKLKSFLRGRRFGDEVKMKEDVATRVMVVSKREVS
jgi:hypothetical protein